MFGRVNQLLRHLSRPLPNYAHTSAGSSVLSRNQSPYAMTSSVVPLKPKPIHTAACLIIGDEVLGGKVCNHFNGEIRQSLAMLSMLFAYGYHRECPHVRNAAFDGESFH